MLFLLIYNVPALKSQHIINFIEDPDTLFTYEDSFVEFDTSSLITTGYLWDRTPFYVLLGNYTGIAMPDTALDYQSFYQAYFDLQRAQLVQGDLPNYDSLTKMIEELSIAYSANPILTISNRINYIRTDAFSDTLLIFT